jgi:hypothetical protein
VSARTSEPEPEQRNEGPKAPRRRGSNTVQRRQSLDSSAEAKVKLISLFMECTMGKFNCDDRCGGPPGHACLVIRADPASYGKLSSSETMPRVRQLTD